MSDLLNALNRLQRAGDEYSGTNQKLIEAVKEVAQAILTALPAVPEGFQWFELPRGYYVWAMGVPERDVKRAFALCWKKSRRSHPFLYAVDEHWKFWYKDTPHLMPDINMANAREFAGDIARGLIDEIFKSIQERKRENSTLLQTLEKAKNDLSNQ